MNIEEYDVVAEQLTTKDAEIARLNEVLKGWSDTGSRYEHRIANQHAEIERLKEDLRITIEVCNENTDLKKLIVELDQEIERLTAALAAIDDHGRASSFVEALRAKDAEIERLIRELREEREAFLSRQLHDTALVTELCDALEEEYGSSLGDRHPYNLIARAREATRK